jgi:hypothetical protein
MFQTGRIGLAGLEFFRFCIYLALVCFGFRHSDFGFSLDGPWRDKVSLSSSVKHSVGKNALPFDLMDLPHGVERCAAEPI